MKNPNLPVMILMILAGGLTGAAISRLVSQNGDAGATIGQTIRTPDPELARKLDELADSNRALRQRVEALENRPAPIDTGAFKDKNTGDELESFRRELAELRANPLLQDPDLISNQITEIQRRREAELAAKRAKDDLARARSQARRRADRMSELLSLTERQSTQLAEVLELTFTTNAPLWKSARDVAGPPKQRLESAVSLKESLELFHQTLPTFLSGAQVEQYYESPDRTTSPGAMDFVNGLIQQLQNPPQ